MPAPGLLAPTQAPQDPMAEIVSRLDQLNQRLTALEQGEANENKNEPGIHGNAYVEGDDA